MTDRRWRRFRLPALRRVAGALSAAAALLMAGTAGLQDANANGDTRTLLLYHEHTRESGAITFRRDGRYVTEGLRQLNWMLRDWRIGEQVEMDPKLFDIVWQVYRESGATGPIHINSGYRSPQTNAALRRRSRAVARTSQHMRGKAMDLFFENVSMARVREIGVKLQRGGVGFYPHSAHKFVHLDAGGVRSWPRLPDAQLARLFPDGRTVHIPRSGRPMPGYELAKADILARGGTVGGYSTYAQAGQRKSFWASLFGGGDDEDEDEGMSSEGGAPRVASAESGPSGFFSFFRSNDPAPEPQATASLRQDGPAPVAAPPPEPARMPAPAPEPVAVVPSAAPPPPRRPSGLAASERDGATAKVASAGPSGAAVPLPPARPAMRGEARNRPR